MSQTIFMILPEFGVNWCSCSVLLLPYLDKKIGFQTASAHLIRYGRMINDDWWKNDMVKTLNEISYDWWQPVKEWHGDNPSCKKLWWMTDGERMTCWKRKVKKVMIDDSRWKNDMLTNRLVKWVMIDDSRWKNDMMNSSGVIW